MSQSRPQTPATGSATGGLPSPPPPPPTAPHLEHAHLGDEIGAAHAVGEQLLVSHVVRGTTLQIDGLGGVVVVEGRPPLALPVAGV